LVRCRPLAPVSFLCGLLVGLCCWKSILRSHPVYFVGSVLFDSKSGIQVDMLTTRWFRLAGLSLH
jgi:hypothetical protein